MKWVTFMGNSRVICPEHVDSRLQECIRMWYQPAMGNLTLETDKKEELLKATHVFQHVWPVWLCQIVLVLDQDICWDQNSKANFSQGHELVIIQWMNIWLDCLWGFPGFPTWGTPKSSKSLVLKAWENYRKPMGWGSLIFRNLHICESVTSISQQFLL